MRWRGALGGTAATIGVLVLTNGGAAPAASGAAPAASGAAPAVSVRASAEGVRVRAAVPGYLLVDVPVDSGGPVVQAVYASFGERSAFAATPYPGELVTNLPGLAQAFGAPSLPVSYPLVVTAQDPSTPHAELRDPSDTYAIAADASGVGTSAVADISPGPVAAAPGIRSFARSTVQKDGSTRATASTSVDGLVVAGILDLGLVRSTTTVVLAPGARRPTVARSIDVIGARVAGTPVTVTDEGVSVAGTAVPGLGTEVAQQAVNTALAAAEVEVKIVRGATIPGGAVGDALEIRSERQLPAPGNPQGTITIAVGGSSASILTGEQGAGIVVAAPAIPVAPAPEDASDDVAPPGASPDVGAPGSGAATPVAAAAPLATRAARAGRTPGLDAFDFDNGFRVFFLVLAFGGVLMVIAVRFTRTRRAATWIS